MIHHCNFERILKEFELNGRCSPANWREFFVILDALDKHRRMPRVCN
jgi:hypothetical protein